MRQWYLLALGRPATGGAPDTAVFGTGTSAGAVAVAAAGGGWRGGGRAAVAGVAQCAHAEGASKPSFYRPSGARRWQAGRKSSWAAC